MDPAAGGKSSCGYIWSKSLFSCFRKATVSDFDFGGSDFPPLQVCGLYWQLLGKK